MTSEQTVGLVIAERDEPVCVCVCVCVREREREREFFSHDSSPPVAMSFL